MVALKACGRRCACCGADADVDPGVRLNVDHVKPRKLFPMLALTLSNLQVLCDPCNHGKGNWDHTNWSKQTTGTFSLTKAWLDKYRTSKGGWTRRQMSLIGEPWPPSKKWKHRCVGRRIPHASRLEFESISRHSYLVGFYASERERN